MVWSSLIVPFTFRLFKSPVAARVPKGTLHAAIRASPEVAELAALATADVYARLSTRPEGLTADEAAARLASHGPNALATEGPPSLARLLLRAALNPLVVLLATLAVISFFTGDQPASVIMSAMIALSVSLSLIQERRAGNAAARLRAMINLSATVLRKGTALEVPVSTVVPGDVVHLAAGDMVPGDVRVVQAKDLFVSQGSLTGESYPVEKFSALAPGATTELIALPTLAFLGTSVESGSAVAVVIATGKATYLGSMAQALGTPAPPTAFDRGITRFTWLMLAFMGVMVPVVFVINGALHGSWAQAFFFAVAVAVGLTPEMLPMVVTVCLSRGAVTMGRKKVIVKRLNAIQNLGAMDVLCTDKTGTLTRDQVTLERHCDVALREDPAVLALGYVNSHFQTGLKNVLDRAILAHQETHAEAQIPALTKVDEIPFDFQRRLMSVVVRTPQGLDRLIAKGAPEAIFPRCTSFELDGQRLPMDHEHVVHLKEEYERLSADGFRVLALATKEVTPRADSTHHATAWGKADEADLVLRGYLAFLDPPKESCAAALKALAALGIRVKVVTGDNELVARRVCHEVGLATDHLLLGADLESLSDEQLADAAEVTTLFARVSPAHKERIIKALQSRRHVVGFLGDGINDAPALHAADVGISVDTAVDIAKESADLILLEKSLLVLRDGVREGRKVFVNIAKYVRMGASSSFGNVLSVVGASLFVPFLPMQPIQILANNLLYDLGQTAIPSDEVDDELIATPRPWDLSQLTRFILFIGPCSSIFDFTTFFVMLNVFHCWDTSTPEIAAASAGLFQTGWFIESLFTQTVVIHVIRTRRMPFVQSRASWQVFLMGGVTLALGLGVTLSPVATWLGFRPLPGLYWPIVLTTLLCYLALTQLVKTWLFHREWV